MRRPRRPQPRQRPVHVAQQMAGLHGRDDFQLVEPRHLQRIRDLRVLDAQAIVLGSVARLYPLRVGRLLCFGECIQSHLDSLVADGMKSNLEAGSQAIVRHLVQRRLIECGSGQTSTDHRNRAAAGPRCAIPTIHPGKPSAFRCAACCRSADGRRGAVLEFPAARRRESIRKRGPSACLRAPGLRRFGSHPSKPRRSPNPSCPAPM